MTFKAYLNNIEKLTGQTPADFKRLAGEIVAWLNEDFGLGRGHVMAIYALLKPEMRKG